MSQIDGDGGENPVPDRENQAEVQEAKPQYSRLSQGFPVPRFRLQILPAIEIGPRLHTWVARASFLSPPLRGWPPSQRKALEGRQFGEVDVGPRLLPPGLISLCI